MTTSYCVRCRTKTPSTGSTLTKTKNNKMMEKSKCAKCGTTKCKFISSGKKGKGPFGSILGSLLPF